MPAGLLGFRRGYTRKEYNYNRIFHFGMKNGCVRGRIALIECPA
jgi:hypothetical protein